MLVSLCDQFKCKYVCFLFKAEEENRPAPSRTVDTVLMEASRARVIPDHTEAAEGRTLCGDQRLRNDILGKISVASIIFFEFFFRDTT